MLGDELQAGFLDELLDLLGTFGARERADRVNEHTTRCESRHDGVEELTLKALREQGLLR